MTDYEKWITSLEQSGIPPLSLDTCCKLLAIVHSCAIEEFVFNNKLRTDISYAQRRCKLYGTGIPDPETVELVKQYVHDMENAPEDTESEITWAVKWPQWAIVIMKERYNVDLPKQRIA